MLIRSLLLFFLMCTSAMSFSQKVLVNVYMDNKVARLGSDTIYYDASRPLTWKDFRGIPDDHHFGGAVTSSGFAFDADIQVRGKVIYLNVGVFVFFSKKDSWKKPYINTEYHLLHEQHHFDITRLGAENFIKQLVASKFTKDNYQQLLETVFNKAFDENSALQNKYDSETQHSINKEQQLIWNDRIAEQIKKLTETKLMGFKN